MKFTLRSLFSLMAVFHSLEAVSQSLKDDSILNREMHEKTVALYYSQINDQSPLYNGRLYTGYDFPFKTGSPFFITEKYTNGSVNYDGMQFDSVALLYDDLSQMLVLHKGNYPIQLVNERISSFTLNGSDFIRLEADSLNRGIPRTGFYQVLYGGRSRVIKWTYKIIHEEASSSEGLLKNIEEKNQYYIRVGKLYKKITSKGEYLDFMNDYKKAVQRFIRKNKLNFRNDKDNTLIQATAYYDQLAK